ncbi:MAG: 4Fe-4S binding protein [Thermodesulfobacteriota bacterium]
MQCLDNVRKQAKSLWSLVVGLRVTGDNMLRPQITVHYPRRTVESLEGYRGHVQLVGKPENPAEPRCICCMMCVNSCPSQCITVQVREEAPPPEAPAAPTAGDKAPAAKDQVPAAPAAADAGAADWSARAVEHGGRLIPRTRDGLVPPPEAPAAPAKAAKPADKSADKGGDKPAKKAAKKVPGVWTLDFTLCSLCGACVAVCPADSLEYSSNVYTASRDKGDYVMDLLARLRARAGAARAEEGGPAPAAGEVGE